MGPRKASVVEETRPALSTELLPHIWKKQNNWILFRKTSKYAARSILKKIEWPQRNNSEYDFVSMRKDSSVQDKEKDSTGMSFSADENMIAIRTHPLLRMCINSGLKERLSQDLHAMWITLLSSFSEHRASWKRRVRKSHDSNARIFIVPWRPNDWIFREFRGGLGDKTPPTRAKSTQTLAWIAHVFWLTKDLFQQLPDSSSSNCSLKSESDSDNFDHGAWLVHCDQLSQTDSSDSTQSSPPMPTNVGKIVSGNTHECDGIKQSITTQGGGERWPMSKSQQNKSHSLVFDYPKETTDQGRWKKTVATKNTLVMQPRETRCGHIFRQTMGKSYCVQDTTNGAARRDPVQSISPQQERNKGQREPQLHIGNPATARPRVRLASTPKLRLNVKHSVMNIKTSKIKSSTTCAWSFVNVSAI